MGEMFGEALNDIICYQKDVISHKINYTLKSQYFVKSIKRFYLCIKQMFHNNLLTRMLYDIRKGIGPMSTSWLMRGL